MSLASIGGKMTFPLGSLYHGTKFAVEGISEALSFELEAIGCKMKIVEPGAIKTDFAGRSFDFMNDESLIEYQQVVQKLMGAIDALLQNASEPEVVAEVIYQAATDGTNQLRYTAGEDAEVLIAQRKQADDATFTEAIKSQFGLSTSKRSS
jgi:short-subunit dehydrogenase